MILGNPNLDAFLAVVKWQTVSAAAKELGLTQTAVTQRIKALESETNTSLFLRSKAGMRLTEEGRLYHRFAISTKTAENHFVATLKNLGNLEVAEVTFLGMSSVLGGRSVNQCQKVMKKWKNLNIHFLVESHELRAAKLKNGEADFSILFEHEVFPEMQTKRLTPLEYALVGHPSWSRRALKTIVQNERMIVYGPGDLLSSEYLQKFGLLKDQTRKKLYANESWTLQRQLTLGTGYGILPLEVAEPLIKNKSLIYLNKKRTLKRPLVLAWYDREHPSPYFSDIIDAIE